MNVPRQQDDIPGPGLQGRCMKQRTVIPCLDKAGTAMVFAGRDLFLERPCLTPRRA